MRKVPPRAFTPKYVVSSLFGDVFSLASFSVWTKPKPTKF